MLKLLFGIVAGGATMTKTIKSADIELRSEGDGGECNCTSTGTGFIEYVGASYGVGIVGIRDSCETRVEAG